MNSAAIKKFIDLLNAGQIVSAIDFVQSQNVALDDVTIEEILAIEKEHADTSLRNNNSELESVSGSPQPNSNSSKQFSFYLSKPNNSPFKRQADLEPEFEIPNPFGKLSLIHISEPTRPY